MPADPCESVRVGPEPVSMGGKPFSDVVPARRLREATVDEDDCCAHDAPF